MIYKVEVGDCTVSEIEASKGDGLINVHFAQGYEEKGDIKYSHFTNFSLTENQCKDMIKSLKLSLKDLQKITIKQ